MARLVNLIPLVLVYINSRSLAKARDFCCIGNSKGIPNSKTKEDADWHLLFMKKISMRKNIIIKGRPRAHLQVRGKNMKKKKLISYL